MNGDASPPSPVDLLGPAEVLDIQQEGHAAALAGEHVRTCPWPHPDSDADRARRNMWIRGYAQGRTDQTTGNDI
jgi:ribosome modulation factor